MARLDAAPTPPYVVGSYPAEMSFTSKSRAVDLLVCQNERSVLEAFLDDHRELLIAAVEGVDESEARERLVPSQTALLGVLHHVAAIERFFFQRTLAGRKPDQIDGLSDATDVSWSVPVGMTVASAVEQFRSASEQSRRTAAHYDLDYVTPHNEVRGSMTLRWIYLRVIEEMSRHAGHVDILKEQLIARR